MRRDKHFKESLSRNSVLSLSREAEEQFYFQSLSQDSVNPLYRMKIVFEDGSTFYQPFTVCAHGTNREALENCVNQLKASNSVFQENSLIQSIIGYFSDVLNSMPKATKKSNNSNAMNTEPQKIADCNIDEGDVSDISDINLSGSEILLSVNNPSGVINNNYDFFAYVGMINAPFTNYMIDISQVMPQVSFYNFPSGLQFNVMNEQGFYITPMEY
jgi:hypothetical protein